MNISDIPEPAATPIAGALISVPSVGPITREQYDAARASIEVAEKICEAYDVQQRESADARWERFDKQFAYYTDAELTYSAHSRCQKCGEGLAYPTAVPSRRAWLCAGVLTGRKTDRGHDECPFAFYEIRSEGQSVGSTETTRPDGVIPSR